MPDQSNRPATENPFATSHTGLPVEPVGRSSWYIVWSLIRFGFGCTVLLLIPLVVLPQVAEMFTEFGIELPVVTTVLLRCSNLAERLILIYVPMVIGVLGGTEIFLWEARNKRRGSWPGVIAWTVLVLILLVTVFSLSMPLISIIGGLRN